METIGNYEAAKSTIKIEVPPAETFNNPQKTRELWGDEELTAQVEHRTAQAQNIVDYLDASEPSPEQTAAYFAAGAELLGDPDNRRLALYWPLENLTEAPQAFRKAYLDSWQDMLFVHDMRDNFKEGDVYEPEARAADPERVVKAAHLVPWLLKSEFISPDDLLALLNNSDDMILKQSVHDTLPLIKDWGLIGGDTEQQLAQALFSVPAKKPEKAAPLYQSPAREKWLAQRDRPEEITDPSANLSGPFSKNAEHFDAEIQDIKNLMPEDALVFVGGSRLKGYGSRTSDLDVYVHTNSDISELVKKYDALLVPEDFAANPELAHILFDTLWLGQDAVIEAGRENLVKPYLELPEGETRDRCLERIELDLLVYRLMHKGFKRTHEAVSDATKSYTDIDGESAFYDPAYRRLATKLFAKYVFIPKISA